MWACGSAAAAFGFGGGLEVEPEHARLHAELARAYLYQGQPEKAQAQLAQFGDTLAGEAGFVQAEVLLNLVAVRHATLAAKRRARCDHVVGSLLNHDDTTGTTRG